MNQSARVDYCNSVLFQTAAINLRPLQLAMNAAARLVVKKRKSDSIMPTLRDTLHWLLVRERIDFKLCLLVYKCLHQLAAPYLESMISHNFGSVNTSPPTVGRSKWPDSRPIENQNCSLLASALEVSLSLVHHCGTLCRQSSLSFVQFCSQLKSVMLVRSFYAWAQPS